MALHVKSRPLQTFGFGCRGLDALVPRCGGVGQSSTEFSNQSLVFFAYRA